MLPQTHHLFINEAMNRVVSWPHELRQDVLQGNDDEDVHIVPLLKWRLRAAGLTHTHVPNGYFGELWFPSAKRRCLVFLSKSRAERNPNKAAWWIGRACHLLGDIAVPARANRVWHFAGDPLEMWIETHVESFRYATIPDLPRTSPDQIVETLASSAAAYPADTTRTPWGRAAFQWTGRGQTLEENVLKAQAHILVPLAIASTKALLEWSAPT